MRISTKHSPDNSDTEPESQLNSRLKGRIQSTDDPDKIIDDLLANFIDHNSNENESFTTTTTEQDNQRPSAFPPKQHDNSDTETVTTYSTLTNTTKNSTTTTSPNEDSVLSPVRNNLKTTIRKGLSFSRMDALEMPQRTLTPSTSHNVNNTESAPPIERNRSKDNVPVHITGNNSVLSQAYNLLKQAKQGTESESKPANLYRSPPGELLIRVLTLEFLEAAQAKIALSVLNSAVWSLQVLFSQLLGQGC